MTPVLVTLDDYKQIAFEVERTAGGNVVVYLPGAPNPWSGSVVYVSEDRVEPLDMQPQDAIKNIRVLGRGSEKLASTGLQSWVDWLTACLRAVSRARGNGRL
jgi:uncharacterized membrane protein